MRTEILPDIIKVKLEELSLSEVSPLANHSIFSLCDGDDCTTACSGNWPVPTKRAGLKHKRIKKMNAHTENGSFLLLDIPTFLLNPLLFHTTWHCVWILFYLCCYIIVYHTAFGFCHISVTISYYIILCLNSLVLFVSAVPFTFQYLFISSIFNCGTLPDFHCCCGVCSLQLF